MPILKFQCFTCGLESKQRVSLGTTKVTCSSCKGEAFIPSDANQHTSTSYQANSIQGVGLQTTGLEATDLNFDRIVAEDSRLKWEQIYNRRQAKWDIIDSHEGSKGSDLVRLPNGEYVVNREASSSLSSQRENTRDIMEKQRTPNNRS